jgi:hypothetical protein
MEEHEDLVVLEVAVMQEQPIQTMLVMQAVLIQVVVAVVVQVKPLRLMVVAGQVALASSS